MNQQQNWREEILSRKDSVKQDWELFEKFQSDFDPSTSYVVPYSDFILVTHYIYGLTNSLLENEKDPFHVLPALKDEVLSKYGLSEAASILLTCAKRITHYCGFISSSLAIAQEINQRNESHPDIKTSSHNLAKQVDPDLLKYCEDKDREIYGGYELLIRLLEWPLLIASLFWIQTALIRYPDRVSGNLAYFILIGLRPYFSNIIQKKEIFLMLLGNPSLTRLEKLISVFQEKFPDDFKKVIVKKYSNLNPEDLFVASPDSVHAVGLAKLVLATTKNIEKQPNRKQAFLNEIKHFEGIWEERERNDKSLVADYIVPSENPDQYPGTIPEVEELCLGYIIDVLVHQDLEKLATDFELFFVEITRGKVLGILPPAESGLPHSAGVALRYQLREAHKFSKSLTWALLPSTRRVGGKLEGYYSSAPYRVPQEYLKKYLEDQSAQERLSKLKTGIAELAAAGAGEIATGPILDATLPGLSPLAVKASTVILNFLLIKLAVWIVKNDGGEDQ